VSGCACWTVQLASYPKSERGRPFMLVSRAPR